MFKKIVYIILFCLLPTPLIASEIIPRLDFQDASVIDVISALARKEKLNLIISGDQAAVLSKKTTLSLKSISPREAIKYVLEASGLDYGMSDEILFVSSVTEGLEKAQALELKYLPAQKAIDIISKVMPSLKVSIGERSHSIVLVGKWKNLKEAEELLASLDRPAPQILIESKVIEISLSDALRIGLKIGDPAGTFSFITSRTTRKTSLTSDIPSTLNTLISNGSASIVANPRIATLDNHEAMINIGSRIPYAVPVSVSSGATQWSINYIDAGIKLKIIPHLGEDEMITTTIKPEVSSISEWRSTAAGDFPVISTRNASATLRVKNGESIVIGGLISEAERENVSRIPILGHIPVVGLLFTNRTKRKEKTEIVFLITPHII
ncbi:MAG: hypothetical protein HQ564_09265 [Candidatus Saganbacteria bacterium]|nr:hypothetical protein [Candidatus Saganbacteria bacterium]